MEVISGIASFLLQPSSTNQSVFGSWRPWGLVWQELVFVGVRALCESSLTVLIADSLSFLQLVFGERAFSHPQSA